MYVFGILVNNWLTEDVWMYFLILYSVPVPISVSVTVSFCFCKCGSVVCLKVRYYDVFSIVLLKIILTFQSLLFFRMSFKIIFPSSVQKVIGILMVAALNLYVALGSMDITKYYSFQSMRIWEVFVSFNVFFNLFLQCFVIFNIVLFHTLS
jgi:hypothetical protein